MTLKELVCSYGLETIITNKYIKYSIKFEDENENHLEFNGLPYMNKKYNGISYVPFLLNIIEYNFVKQENNVDDEYVRISAFSPLTEKHYVIKESELTSDIYERIVTYLEEYGKGKSKNEYLKKINRFKWEYYLTSFSKCKTIYAKCADNF